MTSLEKKKKSKTSRIWKKTQSDYSRLSMGYATTEKACKRVIAPYVNIVRRGQRAVVKKQEEDAHFMFYLRKKPSALLQHMKEFLGEDVDLQTIIHESADSLKDITHATSVRVYMVDETSNEIYISHRHATSYTRRICWKIEEGKSVAAHVACTKEALITEDIIADPRFADGIPYTPATVKSVISVPVVTPEKKCYAVLELLKDMLEPDFTKNDFKIVETMSSWIGAAIFMNQRKIVMTSQMKLNDCLVELTKCFFAETHIFEKMIMELVSFARSAINAERTTFYVLDPERCDQVSAIFDGGLHESDEIAKRNLRINFGRENGIARCVATTGISINIRDAFNDPRFEPEIDDRTGMITRSVLCMPVSVMGRILGVVMAINKMEGKGFTEHDEDIFRTFSTYCAFSLHYSGVVKTRRKSDAKSEVTLGVIKRHVLPCDHQIEYILKNSRMYASPEMLQIYSWYINLDYFNHIERIAIFMIMDIGREEMDRMEVIKYALCMKNFYRPSVTYHNWEHGFNVCHCMYNLLIRNKHRFSMTEQKALMIATLAHDVDHGGVTNNFLVTSHSIMSELYEESPWESHHFNVLMLVLTQIHVFRDVTEEEFEKITYVMRHAILSTDLAYYFRVRQRLTPIVNDGEFSWDIEEHKYMAISIMMTICDLSGQCKPFTIAKRLTDNLYTEFYAQGDIERSMGLDPISLMDRNKWFFVPEDQVIFINVLVLPCADLIRKLMRDSEALYQMAETLRDDWKEIIMVRDMRCWKQEESVVEERNDPKSEINRRNYSA